MHGVKRVIVFCLLIVILPSILITIPLYLRKILFADVVYEVAESDIIEIKDGISSIFCQEHSLKMNTNFNAFQIRDRPTMTTHQKHIRLKKSMTLPDDTLEYWGFYLLNGAHVKLKFCSRYEGSRILVVKGGRTLSTCGLLDHNKNKNGPNYLGGNIKIDVFYEDIKELEPSPSASPSTESLSEEDHKNKTKKDRYKELKYHRKNEEYNLDEQENHAGEDLSNESDAETTVTPVPSIRPKTLKSKNKTGHKQGEGEDSNLLNRVKRQKVFDNLYKVNGKRRSKRNHVYERKYSHGGNAQNFTEDEDISSFENGLFECYEGNILLAEGFPPQQNCSDPHFLENGFQTMVTRHEVTEDGYYYYIFYSDNDLVKNDIHAIFDISKPTFQYSNISGTKGCVNSTNCSFPISFMSDEVVIVEIPTKDGIEHEEDDIAKLYSTCHPRTYVYAIFPISVLILILSCAFL